MFACTCECGVRRLNDERGFECVCVEGGGGMGGGGGGCRVQACVMCVSMCVRVCVCVRVCIIGFQCSVNVSGYYY